MVDCGKLVYARSTKTGQYSGTVTFNSGSSMAQVAVSLGIGYGESLDGMIVNEETGETSTWFDLLS